MGTAKVFIQKQRQRMANKCALLLPREAANLPNGIQKTLLHALILEANFT